MQNLTGHAIELNLIQRAGRSSAKMGLSYLEWKEDRREQLWRSGGPGDGQGRTQARETMMRQGKASSGGRDEGRLGQ